MSESQWVRDDNVRSPVAAEEVDVILAEKAKLRALVVEAANALAGPNCQCRCEDCYFGHIGHGVDTCLVKLAERLKEAVR